MTCPSDIRHLLENVKQINEVSTLSSLGVEKPAVTAIHKNFMNLKHDVDWKIVKSKTEIKTALNNGGYAISVGKDNKIGIVYQRRNSGWSKKTYSAAIIDNETGDVDDQSGGSLTDTLKFLPRGTYYTGTKWNAQTRPDTEKESMGKWEDIIEDVTNRVRDLANKKLHDRIMQIRQDIIDSTEPGEEGFHTTDDFSDSVDIFKKLAEIYKKPDAFEEHLHDAVQAAVAYVGGQTRGYGDNQTTYAGDTGRENIWNRGLHSKQMGTSDAMRAHQSLNTQLNNLPGKQKGKLINKAARAVLYYYENLGTDRGKTPMWNPEKGPYNED